MNFKVILITLIFAPMAAFASNPSQCIPASFLQFEAHVTQFHSFKNVKSCKEVKLNTWYIDDSATPGYFEKAVNEIKKHSDWQVGQLGGTAPKGSAIKCDYYSPSANDNILLDKIFSKKICIKK